MGTADNNAENILLMPKVGTQTPRKVLAWVSAVGRAVTLNWLQTHCHRLIIPTTLWRLQWPRVGFLRIDILSRIWIPDGTDFFAPVVAL